MATVYRNPGVPHPAINPSPDGEGYSTYKEPDTRVPPKPSPVLGNVTIDGVAIPEETILHEAQHHPSKTPGAALQAAARALAIRQLLLNEARRQAIGGDTDNGSSGGDGTTENAEDALIRKLTDKEVAVPSATKAECERYYRNNRQRFKSPFLYEARHILVAAAEDNTAERHKAHELAAVLCNTLAKMPDQFAALAKAHSDCPSSAHGGNLGQIGPGSTVREFENALKELQPGEISAAPVASAFGYHVIALDRAIGQELLPFEAVREQIASWLEAQAWSRAAAQYVSILAGKAKISGIELQGADSPLVQ